MAQAPITVKLPGSKSTAVIRSFVKNKERKAVQKATVGTSEIDTSTMTEDNDEVTFKLKASEAMSTIELQCKFLLIEYEGEVDSPFDVMMDSVYEEDMDAVEAAVSKVFQKNSKQKSTEKK